jgi:hypothetical protein
MPGCGIRLCGLATETTNFTMETYGNHKVWGLEEDFPCGYGNFFSFHVELRGFKIKHYLQAETAIELLDHDCNSVSFNGVCRLSQQGLVSVWGRLLGLHAMVMGCGVGCLQWWIHWIPQNASGK